MEKKTYHILLLLLAVVIAGLVFFSYQKPKTDAPSQEIEATILNQVHSFHHFVEDTLRAAVVSNEASQKKLQHYFLKARLLYKRFEWAAEYFNGPIAKMVNGEPVPEVENADLIGEPQMMRAIPATGLQVMEGILFPHYDSAQKQVLIKEIDELLSNTKILEAYFQNYPLAEWRILDAAKLEVFRILTLGITGFDNGLTLHSMEESAASLKSLRGVLNHYALAERSGELIQQLHGAINYLQKSTNFNSFDRAAFITKYGNKITAGITEMEQQFGYPVKYNRLLRQQAKTLFDTTAFNVNAFAPGPTYYMTSERVDLGKKLFHDPALSGTGTRSCASCHSPDNAFTDGLTKHASIHDDNKLIRRHTPTLLNAALQPNYFFDMRALTLEAQANDVIHNKEEMDGSLQQILKYLHQHKDYKELFSAAYPQKKNPIDSVEVLNALASYVRSLTRLNSRFDQYMRGDKAALTQKEIRGFNLFMGKAKCGTCHFMPLFNGTIPPRFDISEAEVIGVPASLTDSIIDPDPGWYDITGIAYYKHAFKTPTVRNTAKTAPYMHNGIYHTLNDVMEFYNNGGPAGLGLTLDNQTLPEDSLHLSDEETDEIIAFIKSLNSR